MQYERAFSYQLEDPQWPSKLGWATVISLVPVLNFALAGYEVAIIRNVARREAQPLPRWDDLGRKFVDGLLLTLAGLVYWMPVLLALVIPIASPLRSGTFSSGAPSQPWDRLLSTAGWLPVACVVVFLILYTLILSLLRPAMLVNFSREGTFASCFHLHEIFGIISRNLRPYLITWAAAVLAGVGVGLVVGLVNLIIGWVPCAGWVVSLVLGLGSAIYILTIAGHLFGQFRLVALEGHSRSMPPPDEKSKQNPGDLSS